ncbi:MAG: hypothetical protein ACK4GG_04840 [Sphingomonas sp.]
MRQARNSKLGGKNIADWVKVLAQNYALNFEKVHVEDSVREGPPLFVYVAGSIADNPVLITWSGNDYKFVRDNMPRVKILDRDQAIEILADRNEGVSAVTINNYGDQFHGISDSTIINRSRVLDAFKVIEPRDGKAVADALIELAQLIADNQNVPAGAVFESFRREASKPEPDKGTLKKLWDGLVGLMDGAGKVAELGAKLSPLWAV